MDELTQNAACPGINALGGQMIERMDREHAELQMWGIGFLLHLPDVPHVLDIGCGGGCLLERLSTQYPRGRFDGIDCSPLSIAYAEHRNAVMMERGKMKFRTGDVSTLPYPDGTFDAVCACETIYFWPDLAENFKEVARVIKPGGTFWICNEISSREQGQAWLEKIQLNLYDTHELVQFLVDAGFGDIFANLHHNCHYLCLTARKI